MHLRADHSLPLHGWTVLSLRPRGQHGGLRAAATRSGARLLALSTQAIEWIDDAPARAGLQQALKAGVVVFTSPNAVRAANALQALLPRRGQHVLAIGSGTQGALRKLGVAAQAPARMDSEGMLAMPALGDVAGRRIGVVTGAGGRNLLAPALRRRGAEVSRADTYRRVPLALRTRGQRGLTEALGTPQRVLIALSSEEALAGLLAHVPASERAALVDIAIVAASPRLARAAAEAGFQRIATAASARAAAMLRAAADAFV